MNDPDRATDAILVDNGKAKLTLDELGLTQPGMARLMAEIAPRMHKAYHAGKAGNWPLARYFLSEASKIFEIAGVVRPKYDESLTTFLAEDLGPVRKAVEARDASAFEEAFHAMVDRANAYHEQYDKPFIRWKIPEAPPADLDLTPRE